MRSWSREPHFTFLKRESNCSAHKNNSKEKRAKLTNKQNESRNNVHVSASGEEYFRIGRQFSSWKRPRQTLRIRQFPHENWPVVTMWSWRRNNLWIRFQAIQPAALPSRAHTSVRSNVPWILCAVVVSVETWNRKCILILRLLLRKKVVAFITPPIAATV